MKILYICHRFPFPPKRGGKIRPFIMIRHFSQRHEVTVASLVRSEEEGREGQDISPYCANFEMVEVSKPVQMARMVARLPTSTASTLGYFYSAELALRIREMLRRRSFDLIFVHCSSVAQYVSEVRGIPKILDFGDMDSQKWLEYARFKSFPLNLGYRLEGSKMLRVEKRLAGCFDLCTATTRAEWETLNGYGVDVASDWFPNGVDSDFFAPDGKDYDPDTISFIGRMDYYPNQECMADFCANTLPLLRAKRPNVKLLIVGADPSAAMRRLGDLPGVTVTGSVPDVRPFVRGAALMVAPLNIARGTQNKILEAMAMGVPVVTSRVAAGGVDAVADEHFLVTETYIGYANAILKIMDDKAERNRLAIAGRARMISNHAWPKSMERLDGIVERCIDGYDKRAIA